MIKIILSVQRAIKLIAFMFFSVVASLLFGPGNSPATEAEITVPADLQAAMFQKIFRFDKTLAGKEVKILIVYEDKAPEIIDELKKEFEKLESPVASAKASELSAKIAEFPVIYIMPGIDTEAVKKLSSENSVLSISGLPELAQNDVVSIAVGVLREKPIITVNMVQLYAEGHEFSAEFLKLAKIISLSNIQD